MLDVETKPLSPDPLETMPLHLITRELGTTGLIDRFKLEVAKFDESTQTLLNEAFEFSQHHHREQLRKDGPYLNHLLRVTIRIMHHFGVKDPAIIAAALLHDSVEDQYESISGIEEKATAQTESLRIIAGQFGQDASDLVEAVTNPEFDMSDDWHDEYRQHVIKLLKENPRAAIIKLSDFIDNSSGLKYTPKEKAEKLAPKYLPLIVEFKEAINTTMGLSDEVKEHLIEKMDKTAILLESIIAGRNSN